MAPQRLVAIAAAAATALFSSACTNVSTSAPDDGAALDLQVAAVLAGPKEVCGKTRVPGSRIVRFECRTLAEIRLEESRTRTMLAHYSRRTPMAARK